MRHLLSALALSFLAASAMAASAVAADFGRVYDGDPIVHAPAPASPSQGCGTLLMNADGTYENGYAWAYAGIVPPDYGAFAECFSVSSSLVCSAVFDFSQIGNQVGQTMDVFLWSDAGGLPGVVICALSGVDPGPIAFWPNLSRHTVPITCDCTDGSFWVGWWGDWRLQTNGWFIGADLDGFGGCPMTHVAPGIGYPTGWANVSIIWGPTQALGIGCETVSCGPVPVAPSTFGAVKRLYR